MIDRILRRKELGDKPPVLVDIGASGAIHAKWKYIAPYATCIAFDADDREMTFEQTTSSGFKKLIKVNRIVTDLQESEVDFFLTKSPFCSSTLEPDLSKLAKWPFQDLFSIEKKVKLKAVRLSDALAEAKISYVDCIKIDTQGTDLRIFKSLSQDFRNQILSVEFEPGIIDAYFEEDKLWDVLGFMAETPFFMSEMTLKGVQRINPLLMHKLHPLTQRSIRSAHKISPGWCEITYLNTLAEISDKRSMLLTCGIALADHQFGFAAEIAEMGLRKTGDSFFGEIRDHSIAKLNTLRIKWPFVALKKRFEKAFF